MITGKITKIISQFENNWGIYQISTPAGEDIKTVGVIPDATIGCVVTLEGEYQNNNYGEQYKISSVLSVEEDCFAGIRRFLIDGYITGIGEKKANLLIQTFGEESLDLFETEEGQKKLATLKGFSEKTIKKMVKSYEQNKIYKDIVLFLNGSGTVNQVESIFEKYGADAPLVLKKNPYRLQMDIDGFGFLRVDKLALASGIKPNSIFRVIAAIKYSIEEAQVNGGHCYLTVEDIREKVTNLLVPTPKFEDISEIIANNALKDWVNNKEKLISAHNPSAETLDTLTETDNSRKMIINSLSEAIMQAISDGDFINDNGKIYTKKMYETETFVAETIAQMCNQNPVRYADVKIIEKTIKEVEKRKTEELKQKGNLGNFEITKEQRDAVFLAAMNRISIISGGPGRGKTAISEIVARTFLNCGKYIDTKDIIMLAPTGRAAQRITESTGYDAMTAHRAVLRAKRDGFPKNKLVLCDESSMIDINLMKNILTFAKDCNLILVGDVDQIASVGPGKVLKDMIDSNKIPCILLKEGHRNSGTIAHNSELINAGYKINKYCYDEHFQYFAPAKEKILDTMVNDYIAMVNKYGIENVMLCTAMKERGVVSVNKLNETLQERFTKGHSEAKFNGGKKFRIGDRVMQTKNDYNFIKVDNATKEKVEGVFNGEKGTVANVLYDEEDESYRIVVKFDDNTIGGYTKHSVANLTLAYATTLHKCQGSEAACMMMSYTFGDYILLNRALFYTGETRAKKEFRFYGEEKFQYNKIVSAFDIAVGKNEDSKRNTMLKERLIDFIN